MPNDFDLKTFFHPYSFGIYNFWNYLTILIVLVYTLYSSETSVKGEFSAVAVLFSFAFSRTVVYMANENVAFVIDDGYRCILKLISQWGSLNKKSRTRSHNYSAFHVAKSQFNSQRCQRRFTIKRLISIKGTFLRTLCVVISFVSQD